MQGRIPYPPEAATMKEKPVFPRKNAYRLLHSIALIGIGTAVACYQ